MPQFPSYLLTPRPGRLKEVLAEVELAVPGHAKGVERVGAHKRTLERVMLDCARVVEARAIGAEGGWAGRCGWQGWAA